MFGRNPDDWCYVTKYYLNHRITGGGNITAGRGRGSAKITFGGNVGIAGDEGLVGQYQINFHNVSDDEVGNIDVAKGHFHSTDITFLDFKWLILCPQPDPPDDAFFNWAEFKADGRFNGEPGWSIHVRVTDYGEGKKAKPDTIRIKLYKGSILEYDSNQDFPYDWVCLTSEWRMHELDGGNIQIHKIDD